VIAWLAAPPLARSVPAPRSATEIKSRVLGEFPERIDETGPEGRAVLVAEPTRAVRTVVIATVVACSALLGTILVDDAFLVMIGIHMFVVVHH